MKYEEVASKEVEEPNGISTKGSKLKDIGKTLLGYKTQYVWMDTIRIDKSNLFELDEAISQCMSGMPTVRLLFWNQKLLLKSGKVEDGAL
jgi:hypothetical protein